MTSRDPALDAAYEEVAKRLTTGKRVRRSENFSPRNMSATGAAFWRAVKMRRSNA